MIQPVSTYTWGDVCHQSPLVLTTFVKLPVRFYSFLNELAIVKKLNSRKSYKNSELVTRIS